VAFTSGLVWIADVGASHQVIEKTNNYIKQCQQVLSTPWAICPNYRHGWQDYANRGAI